MFALVPKMFDYYGLGALSSEDKSALLRMFYSSLELHVGHDLAQGLSSRELQDFEEIMDYLESHQVAPEDDPSLAWLEHVRPDYREVVHRWLLRLLEEMYDRSEWIAQRAGIELGRTGSDPVSQTYDFMMVESRAIRSRRAIG